MLLGVESHSKVKIEPVLKEWLNFQSLRVKFYSSEIHPKSFREYI